MALRNTYGFAISRNYIHAKLFKKFQDYEVNLRYDMSHYYHTQIFKVVNLKRIQCIKNANNLSNKKLTMSLKPQDQRIDRAPKLDIIRRQKLSAVKDRNNQKNVTMTNCPKLNSVLE